MSIVLWINNSYANMTLNFDICILLQRQFRRWSNTISNIRIPLVPRNTCNIICYTQIFFRTGLCCGIWRRCFILSKEWKQQSVMEFQELFIDSCKFLKKSSFYFLGKTICNFLSNFFNFFIVAILVWISKNR